MSTGIESNGGGKGGNGGSGTAPVKAKGSTAKGSVVVDNTLMDTIMDTLKGSLGMSAVVAALVEVVVLHEPPVEIVYASRFERSH